MHLWNSCTRSMSSCIIRYVPSGRRGAGLNAGTRLAISKLNETSVTRSRSTGKVFIGATVMGTEVSSALIRVMHISRGFPFTSALHEPHFPALQFQRTARSPAWVAWSTCRTSRRTMPSSQGTSYSRSCPPEASPLQIRSFATRAIRHPSSRDFNSSGIAAMGSGDTDKPSPRLRTTMFTLAKAGSGFGWSSRA